MSLKKLVRSVRISVRQRDHKKQKHICVSAFCFIAFQAVLHESAEQTTTRYAGAHQMLYKKFPNLGTIRVFRPYCRRKENFYGESI